MRLIDADKMRENLVWRKEQSGDSDSFWDDVIERLDVQPTVDAVPVRRGRWIDTRTAMACIRHPKLLCVWMENSQNKAKKDR